MAEYIEREALMERLNKKKPEAAKLRYAEGFNDAILRARSMVSSAPAADVVEVRHGEWRFEIDRPDLKIGQFRCSVCGIKNGIRETNYCPNCGAKMDGKGEGE